MARLFRSRLTRFTLVTALGAAVLSGSGWLLLWLSGPYTCPTGTTPPVCTRVLFIGNSYTYVNDLPSVFASLARSGGRQVEVAMVAQSGETLAQHAASPATLHMISAKKWDVVVLQEQSQIPSIDQQRQEQMYPAGRELIARIRAVNARPMLFLTWARQAGWPENGLSGYDAMQAAVNNGYLTLAKEQKVAVAPVGLAWRSLLLTQGDPGLWQDDGSHPTITGTYLAACVFYAAIYGQSPRGLSYRAGLSEAEAQTLQTAASQTPMSLEDIQ